MRVLLAEDDELLGSGLKAGLGQHGFAVDWVRDGVAAERELLAQQHEAAVLDLGLPRQDGLDALAAVRAKGVRTPVLVLNGADDKAVSDADILAFEKEMDAAGADWQFVDFSGAVHCFAEASAGTDLASNCRYDERAAKRAYRMMDDFFRERFAAD